MEETNGSCSIYSIQRLQKIANAADSISQGDLIEKTMRSNMMWSLLPLHACFSFIIPGSEMSGSLDTLVRFPSWFGRNSKAMRFNRYYNPIFINSNYFLFFLFFNLNVWKFYSILKSMISIIL